MVWAAATDNVAVTSYVVYRSGVQIATSTALTFTDLNVPVGTYTYSVAARDAVGNTSAQSTAVTVNVYLVSDINRDGKIDIFDLSTLLTNWARTGTNTSDLNNDGVVNIYDLSILLAAWTG